MSVKYIQYAILAMLLLLPATGHAADPQTDSLRATFRSTLQFNSEEVNSPKKIPEIIFDGSLLIVGDQVRVEVQNSITQEPSVALLDIEAGTAALLYPDNLNGERMPLGDDFRTTYLELFRDFAMGRTLGKVPGWELASSKLDSGATEYLYAGKSSRSVSFISGTESSQPKLTINSPRITVVIELSEVEQDIKAAPDSFSVPDDFAIRESEQNLADLLPSL